MNVGWIWIPRVKSWRGDRKLIPHGVPLCDSLISALEHIRQHTSLDYLKRITFNIHWGSIFLFIWPQIVSITNIKTKVIYLCNFFITGPEVFEVYTLPILPCANWLFVKVNVNLKSSKGCNDWDLAPIQEKEKSNLFRYGGCGFGRCLWVLKRRDKRGRGKKGMCWKRNWFRNNIRKACDLEKCLSARSWDSELYAYLSVSIVWKNKVLSIINVPFFHKSEYC